MASQRPNQLLLPSQVSESVWTRDLRAFLLLYGDALLLLVGIPDGEVELPRQLGATDPGSGALPFKTENYALPRVLALPGRPAFAPEEPEALARIMSRGTHFALSLRKRSDSDALYADRISVGRARNKDIVLRHSSISKFHAWFENAERGLLVADADSKNLTRLNGERLSPSEKVPVRSGDVVRFGAIDCVLCSPSVLWTCLHPSVARMDRHDAGGS